MKILIVIPSRYKSSRFPGKSLADLVGKPMVQHVYEKAIQSKKASRVVVATDDQRIYDVITKFGGDVMMTDGGHLTGTDRIIEVSEKVKGDIFINVQGDEPLIRPEDIDLLIDKMVSDPTCEVATLCHPIHGDEALNPNVVKVIRSGSGKALYFSRRAIPFSKKNIHHVTYLKHVGVYGYSCKVLSEYKNLPYSYLENMEQLEQLRLLEAGISIDVIETGRAGQGVDTPEDLEKVKQIMMNRVSQN
ncbi:MAG: 3-deoxy-manno-octulosonate cytidylyltransferase [Desulfobacteraceae bacterium]|nr:3-deoxy-manno-octulosonate cytidylyltransferase [Desulfobacteraceae bacterium]